MPAASLTRRSFVLALGAAGALPGAARALYFEPNRGQFGPQCVFGTEQERWRGVFLPGEMRLLGKNLVGDPGPRGAAPAKITAANVALDLVGSTSASPVGEDLRQGRSDYYFHGDPKTFVRNTPHYYRLRYPQVWPGVDLVVRGWEGLLEITPEADSAAALRAAGFYWRGSKIGKQGDAAVALTAWGRVRQQPPRSRSGAALGLRWVADANDVLRLI